MTTTKIITNVIYWGCLPVILLFDFDNFPFYFVAIGILIQAVIIISVYRINKRNFTGDAILVNDHSTFKLKEIFLAFIFILLYLYLLSLLFFKTIPRFYLMVYFSAVIVSVIIQFLLERGKKTPVFIINSNNFCVNDLFVKTYNLEQLAGIGYDDYTEIYIVRFANNKRIKIKQDDFRQEDLDDFFTVMISKTKGDVEIFESIRNELIAEANQKVLPA